MKELNANNIAIVDWIKIDDVIREVHNKTPDSYSGVKSIHTLLRHHLYQAF